MDTDRFDVLTRRFSSRRAALAGLLGGIAAVLGLGDLEEASAHNLAPKCKAIKDPKQRRACLRRARAHKRKAHSCKPKPKAVTCHNRCGSVRNNCKKPMACTCTAGKGCLANTSCSRQCGPAIFCPPGCACQLVLAETPTSSQCVPAGALMGCGSVPQPCVTSANCPVGFFCALLSGACGTNRCVPTCPL